MKNVYDELGAMLAKDGARLEILPKFIGFTRLDQGWFSEAWVRQGNWYVIYLMEHGELRLGHEGRTISLTPGQSAIVGPDIQPSYQTSVPVEFRELWLNVRVPGWDSPLSREIVSGRIPPETPALLDHIADDVLSGRELEGLPLLRPRLQLLLALLAEDARESAEGSRTLTANQRIRLLRWVREHLADPPTPEQLAGVVGLTPAYFTRLFKSSFGQSPRDWLILERVRAARRLLDEGGLPLAQAMRAAGFRSHAHFSRTMKRLTGRTPSGHRGWNRSRGE